MKQEYITDETKTPHIIRKKEHIEKLGKTGKMYRCLTGIRPSGKLHLGHYKGALENWLFLQQFDFIENFFLIADYQVLSDHINEKETIEHLPSIIKEIVADWLAIGLDPEKSYFVLQSCVPEFSELFTLLTMFANIHDVFDNPTLKHEMKKLEEKNTSISLGFINYPVSQVADILLPLGEIIPIGEDQIPHIELARDIIKKVNNICGTNFPLPLAFISETSRLIGIDGKEKMSKSLKNTIPLSAEKEEIETQVYRMYTDPGKQTITSPGNIENHVVFHYLDIFYENKEYLQTLKERYKAGGENSIGDGYLKKLLTETLENFIAPIREKRKHYLQNEDIIYRALQRGNKKMREVGAQVIQSIKQGLHLMNIK